MLNYKFERASKYLSLHDYKHALFFVHSTRADVRYIKNVVARAANGVEVEMTCSGLYSFKEVLLMGPKLGAFWLFMLIFSIMYSIYNCYRNVSNHLNRVMSPDDDNNEGNHDDGIRDNDGKTPLYMAFFKNDTSPLYVFCDFPSEIPLEIILLFVFLPMCVIFVPVSAC